MCWCFQDSLWSSGGCGGCGQAVLIVLSCLTSKFEDCFKLKEVLGAISLQMRQRGFQRAEVTSLTLLAVNDRKP